jgi:zinc and cadmium transporter
MITIWLYTIISVIIVSLISLIGVFALSMNENTLKKIIIYFVSFSAGALFGDAFIHILPEAFKLSTPIMVSLGALSGIIVFFVMEKIIHWRHCHTPTEKHHIHPVGILNLVGDGVHNVIDGLIIAASYLISVPLGIATTIAVIAHEIPQELGDFGILIHAGFKKKKALLFNLLSALTSVIGAIVGLIIGTQSETVKLFLLPLAAGGFIYIAGTDLIPELHKDVCESPELSRSLLQLLFFVLGIGLMFAMTLLEI